MKLSINKNIKFGLITVSIVIIMIFSYMIYDGVSNPGIKEKTIPVYSYENKGTINYEVVLKPNDLYTESRLGEGQLYITEFVDYIDTNMTYEFNGERDAEIKGSYEITAKVRGYIGEGEKTTNIWEKDFPIKQLKQFTGKDGKASVDEKIKLNITEYNLFAQNIKEASKINCQTSLTLYMNITLEGTTDKGSIEEFISPSIIVPLDNLMFEIAGSNIADRSGAIEETVNELLPVNKNQITAYTIIVAVMIIALIILIFFTTSVNVKAPMEKELGIIFRKYGERMVALNLDIDVQDAIAVKAFEDLIKISDEIGKPILYRYSEDYKELNKFYVRNEDEAFVFSLKYLADSGQAEDTKILSQDDTTV